MAAELWTKALQLSRRIGDTSDISTWEREQHSAAGLPLWERNVVSHLIALVGDETINYLDAHVVHDEPRATFVAFTDARIIRIAVDFTSQGNNRRHEITSDVLSRSLVKSIRLRSLDDVEADTREFPTRLAFDVVLESDETISLPLNRYPRPTVAAELVGLFNSLLPR